MRFVSASLALFAACFVAAAPPKDLGTALAGDDLPKLQQALSSTMRQRIKNANDMSEVVAEPAFADKLAVWQLIKTVGVEAIQGVRKEPEGKPFLEWLGRHPRALEDYLSSGDPREYNLTGLSVWRSVWAAFPESRDGVLLRLAEATGLTFAVPLNNMADGKPVDAVARYAFYLKSFKAGALFPYFEKAMTWELRYVVGSWALDEDMAWVRGKVGAGEKNQLRIGEACWMVPYRDKNAKGVSVQEGAKYYDNRPMTLPLMVEVGGVCGAISRFGTSAAQAFGIPAMPVTQPGHCAHIWRDRDWGWMLGQDISGWAQSGEHPGIRTLFGARPTFIRLVDDATIDGKAFIDSQRLWWASTLAPSLQLNLLAKAAAKDPCNYPVLRAYLAAAKPALKPVDFIALMLKVGRPIAHNPYALCELLNDNMNGLLGSITTDKKTRDFIEGVLQAIADAEAPRQLGCAQRASAYFFGTALRYATNTQHDFEAPIRDGRDAARVWEKLDGGRRMDWLRSIEIVLRTGMKRKDLYEQPLNLYASFALQDSTASSRAIPVLGALAKRAVADKATPFAQDACRKLAELCDKVGDKAGADEWRKAGSK